MAIFKKLGTALNLAGIDAVRLGRTLTTIPRFLREARRYRRAWQATPLHEDGEGKFGLRWSGVQPILFDYADQAGTASGHYFHQDLWAARKVYERKPARHVDIGSRVDGFVAHVLSFMPVEVIDIRPLTSGIPGLSFIQADATRLEQIGDNTIESLSSLHAVEHFGLGRYGDPIAPLSCFNAMAAFARVLGPGGRLYFSVPIGRERASCHGSTFSKATCITS